MLGRTSALPWSVCFYATNIKEPASAGPTVGVQTPTLGFVTTNQCERLLDPLFQATGTVAADSAACYMTRNQKREYILEQIECKEGIIQHRAYRASKRAAPIPSPNHKPASKFDPGAKFSPDSQLRAASLSQKEPTPKGKCNQG